MTTTTVLADAEEQQFHRAAVAWGGTEGAVDHRDVAVGVGAFLQRVDRTGAPLGRPVTLAAREVFVVTMGVVYGVGGEVDEQDVGLRERLLAERGPGGGPACAPLVALSLMICFAPACPCTSTLAVGKRETGGYRWPAFLFAYRAGLAYLVKLGVY